MARRFQTTRWSLVEAAANSASPGYQEALAWLCRIYWPAVYAFIRSRGKDPDSSEDLTQGFFTQLLDKRFLKAARRVKGRFRSFLLVCVKAYMANEWDRERAEKRGGGKKPIRLDCAGEESFRKLEPEDLCTPDKAFEKQWANTVLHRVMSRLEREAASASQEARFHLLRPFLMDDSDVEPYKDVAKDLGISEGAVKVAVHSLRKKFAKLLRDEVAQTVSNPSMIDDEIRFLFAAIEN